MNGMYKLANNIELLTTMRNKITKSNQPKQTKTFLITYKPKDKNIIQN
jgi:hypothetical protein